MDQSILVLRETSQFKVYNQIFEKFWPLWWTIAFIKRKTRVLLVFVLMKFFKIAFYTQLVNLSQKMENVEKKNYKKTYIEEKTQQPKQHY